MLLTKEVEITLRGVNIRYYNNLGYHGGYNETIKVKIEDLQLGSSAIVEVLCDYCKKSIIKTMYKDYNRRIKKYGNCACKNCKPLKTYENNMKKYGFSSPSCTEEVKKKIEKTNINRYGSPCSLQNEDIRNKAIETCRLHYGVDYSIQSKEISEKIKNSLKTKYGVDNPFKSPEIRKKITNTFYKNMSQKTSTQQLYINALYHGELNYPISNFNADVCLTEEKIIIEYDGGGHKLNLITGRESKEEYEHKELIRNQIVKRAGYKQIRIISSKDKLPSDTILLQMLNQAKDYFDTTVHTWVEYDIDNFTLRNAENKDGVYYDFGELRKISKAS